MKKQKQTVVVLGASPKPERYSNQAVRMLLEHGHTVIPVHPAIPEIEGLRVAASLPEVAGPVDTLTLYLSPERSATIEQEILALHPARVIFNPGTESAGLAAKLAKKDIQTEEACTLVLLSTGQF
jgi:predicted CoA-binding protein